MNRYFASILVPAVLNVAAPAVAQDRILRADVNVPAPVNEVWRAWTTDAGMATFFAPRGHVDPRIDGTYDVWFDPAAAPGMRGAEGMRILAVETGRRFAFTWNAPPSIPAIREQRTLVVLDFAAREDGSTALRFSQIGWGEGDDWDRAYEYFDFAWRAVVLPRLVHRFEVGPIDWTSPPTLSPVAGSIRQTLDAAATTSAVSDSASNDVR